MRASRLAWFVALVCLVLFARPASAHPLGNFTINHLAEVATKDGQLQVVYVLDIAEIPTFQIMHQASGDGNWSRAQMQTWADSEIALVQSGFDVKVDGKSLTLQPSGATARNRPGAGGLPLLYWVGHFSATLQAGEKHAISINDGVYQDRRIGWKDIIVAPQTEPTHALQVYPSALIGTPRRVTSLTFTVQPNGTASSIVASSDAAPSVGGFNTLVRVTALSEMFASKNQSPLFILLTILAAFALGAMHAVEPGHGKALLAFTLVGARATTKQAMILAASLTFAHTIGVFILGGVLFFAAGFVSENIYPWITLISGIAIAIIGARSLMRYFRGRTMFAQSQVQAHDHAQPHDHAREGAHQHDHGDGHSHSHVIPGSTPIKFSAAVWAAMSGGVAPCPAAIVVLLAALRLHKLGYGMILIVIFSLGLAAVLTGLGIGVVHGASWLSQRSKFDKLVAYGPLISACLISIVGAVMVGQGFSQQGVHVWWVFVSALTLAAIVGYVATLFLHNRPAEVQATT
ncbi:MAG: hypothetical protein M3Y21_10085 [Candidatus Eremiobacteraeota bacterium]|nr:hypothetical protein [Candidatus Eremiobacteraeota bacterium]